MTSRDIVPLIETGHQKVRLGDRAEAAAFCPVFVRYAAAAKNPMAKGVLPGLLQADRGFTMQKSGYRGNSETTDKRIEASVFFSSFAALSFAFSIIRSVFGTISNNKVKEKGETECTRHFPWNWPDVR